MTVPSTLAERPGGPKWKTIDARGFAAIRVDVIAVLLDLRTDAVAVEHIRGIS